MFATGNHEVCAPAASYKRPRKIIFAEVPRNPTGKLKSRNCVKNMAPPVWLRLKRQLTTGLSGRAPEVPGLYP